MSYEKFQKMSKGIELMKRKIAMHMAVYKIEVEFVEIIIQLKGSQEQWTICYGIDKPEGQEPVLIRRVEVEVNSNLYLNPPLCSTQFKKVDNIYRLIQY